MGVVTALGFCRGGEINQCLAHYIMGSAFIGYAVILVIMLNLGGAWLARRGCSQEMLDSSVILVWGIINTFTEHQGGPWTHKDMQHTMMVRVLQRRADPRGCCGGRAASSASSSAARASARSSPASSSPSRAGA